MAQRGGNSLQKALAKWQEENKDVNVEEAEVIKLICQIPPIEKLEVGALNNLAKCKKLSLSSNSIDKMINLPQLRNLEILSLGRNLIKKISGLEEVGGTLRELWLSYNQIEKLDGLQPCVKLQTLFMSNNRIKNWDEIDKLKDLPEIANVLFIGNPIYDLQKNQEMNLLMVLKKVPSLKNIDGKLILETHQEKVKLLE